VSAARLALFVIVTVALLVPASASAWTGNTWRSPTRNIACHYEFGYIEMVRCETENDGFAITMYRGQRAIRNVYFSFAYRAPILRYGQTWTAPGFRCVSRFNGMSCYSGYHGFFLNRTSYRVW
jgi:hypothetical protein